MKIKIRTIAIIGLIAILISSENFFYLINPKFTKIFGIFEVNDIFIFMALIWGIFIMYQYRHLPNPKYYFKYVIIFAIFLMISSSIQSYFKYGQSIMLGIRPQRFWIIWALMYFPISKLLYLNKISYKKLEQCIFYIGTIEIILYCSQYFLQDYVTILNVGTNDTYSSTRFYVSNVFLNLLLFINLNRIFNKKKILSSSLYVSAILFVIIIVGKMRMTFIAVSCAIIVGTLVWKNGKVLKVLVSICLISCSLILSNVEEVKSIITTLQGDSSINTLDIRDKGRKFYIDEIKENPILGGGYINTQWEPSAIASRVDENIYWVDNGIFGFAYFYGTLGLTWIIILFFKIFKMSIYIKDKYNCYTFFLMPIYWVISMVTELNWYYNSFFVMTLMICMLEKQYR